MFREDTFTFTPFAELLISMPFEFISNLKVGAWTCIDNNWLRRLNKYLTHADNHAIKQIGFVQKISLTLLYDGSQEYENENDQFQFLYQVFTTKSDKLYVDYMQIHGIVGDEEW